VFVENVVILLNQPIKDVMSLFPYSTSVFNDTVAKVIIFVESAKKERTKDKKK